MISRLLSLRLESLDFFLETYISTREYLNHDFHIVLLTCTGLESSRDFAVIFSSYAYMSIVVTMVYDPPLRSPYLTAFEYHDRLMASLEELFDCIRITKSGGAFEYDLVRRLKVGGVASNASSRSHVGRK